MANASVSRRVSKEDLIAALAVLGIALHLMLRWSVPDLQQFPLYLVLALGGVPLVAELTMKLLKREFGSDLLAGISIIVALVLGEYLAGSLVVLMLSGGNALEQYAVARASSVLAALARRIPNVAHLRRDGEMRDVSVETIAIGDHVVVFPHEVCPVDGEVIEGRSTMDESYLTGEPFMMSKTPGTPVISGAVNGESSITIRAIRPAKDSRYAKIIQVMHDAEQQRPKMRRLGDTLGAWYTPLALVVATAAWIVSGEAIRFLAVLVVATPCPLLIAIPVSIIGSISLAAKRGIIVRDPAVLETIDTCKTMILDKTGTLTYGLPQLTAEHVAPSIGSERALQLVASLERYSKHPLSYAIVEAAKTRGVKLIEADEAHEPPGAGLVGRVAGVDVRITSRKQAEAEGVRMLETLAPSEGLECFVLFDGVYAAAYRFHDSPRRESESFIKHLGGKHGISRVLIVSGDRESEVRYLADQVGISEIYGSKSPEEKVEIVRRETEQARTIFVGDGVNDAPALMTATVGIAFGQQHEVTSEAAGVVIMDSSLRRVDEFLHIGRRMRTLALQSAVGGMALSVGGMGFAAAGALTPVAGALLQEAIDVLAILNALRSAARPRRLADF